MKGNRALILAITLGTVGTVHAAEYTFTPSPNDLNDLDHYYNYTWGIGWNPQNGEVITEATLTIKNIYDWQEEEDHLYIHLMDEVPLGVHSEYDDQGGGDAFLGEGVLIDDWNDPMGGSARGFNLTYKFSDKNLISTLAQYAQSGTFGFGFDPDCHYFNDGVEFRVETETVPEPASIITLSVAAALAVARKMTKSSK